MYTYNIDYHKGPTVNLSTTYNGQMSYDKDSGGMLICVEGGKWLTMKEYDKFEKQKIRKQKIKNIIDAKY